MALTSGTCLGPYEILSPIGKGGIVEAIQIVTHPGQAGWPRWSPDGGWLAFFGPPGVWRVPTSGGEPEFLTKASSAPLWSRDGKRIYFAGVDEMAGNVWALSLEDRSERQMTGLSGRRVWLYEDSLATDGQYLYFTWLEDVGDIRVMDVVQ